jgi:hypothetical protein
MARESNKSFAGDPEEQSQSVRLPATRLAKFEPVGYGDRSARAALRPRVGVGTGRRTRLHNQGGLEGYLAMAIRISEVKSSRLSDDHNELIIDSTGKYTGDLELRFARECLDQLLQMLMQAREIFEPSAKPAPGVPASTASLAEPPVAQPGAGPVAAPKSKPDEVRFEIPKNFTVTADTSGRGLVLMIINHRLENQNGYAFSPDAAKQVAGGLIKSADAALALKASGPSTS